MREITKRYWYFTNEDKKAFVEWLKSGKITQTEFAKQLEISNSYLSDILKGKKPLTEELKLAFNKCGYRL